MISAWRGWMPLERFIIVVGIPLLVVGVIIMDPKSLLAVIVLVALLVWFFIQGGWRSATGGLLIAISILIILRLLGIWAW